MMKQLQKQKILTIAGGTDYTTSDNDQNINDQCALYQKKIDEINKEIGHFTGIHIQGIVTQNTLFTNHAGGMA